MKRPGNVTPGYLRHNRGITEPVKRTSGREIADDFLSE